ncbi:colicin-like ion channel [Proteus phage M4H10_20]|nr:colicin-like ion channel [Proteus phage M4H10_20]
MSAKYTRITVTPDIGEALQVGAKAPFVVNLSQSISGVTIEELTKVSSEVKKDALSASNSAKAAKVSETNAKGSADSAKSQADLAKEQVVLATEQVEEAKNQVGLAKEQVVLATEQVVEAKNQVDLAKEQVGLATEQVSKAKDQVGLAKEQVVLATEQANVAANQALEATTQASLAKASSDEATTQATLATTKADEAKVSAESSSTSAMESKNSATEADNSAKLAEQNSQDAKASADAAKVSETNAKGSADSAETSLNEIKSHTYDKDTVDSKLDEKVNKAGDTMGGPLETTTKVLTKSANGQHSIGLVSNNSGEGNIERRDGDNYYIYSLPERSGSFLLDGDFGLGSNAVYDGSTPSSQSPKDANDITSTGFYGGGGSSALNYFNNYYPILSMTRTGGDGTGYITQIQGSEGKLGFRHRIQNNWTDWYHPVILNHKGLQKLDGSIVAQNHRIGANPISATRDGNDYLNLYPPKVGDGKDLGFFQYNLGNVWNGVLKIPRVPAGETETLITSGLNILSNRFLCIKADKDNQASYIETQNLDGSLRWRVGSMGANKTRVSLATPNMSASIEQINSISSKGFYLDQNLMMDINGGYEHRFYGFGTNPGVSHTMMFARDTDKMIGFNFRNEDGYVGTLLRIDGKNRVVKVNETPVMVQGDYGLGGNYLSGVGRPAKLLGNLPSGFYGYVNPKDIPANTTVYGDFIRLNYNSDNYQNILMPNYGDDFMVIQRVSASSVSNVKVMTSNMWTTDSNGFYKRASPIIDINPDGTFTTNDESEGATVTRVAQGEYLIEGVLGFNSDAGWGGVDGGIEIPLDVNKQPLIWVDSEVMEDGSILVRTYHRTHPSAPKFARNDIAGYSDGDPIDIPNGRFISVRVQMPEQSIYNVRMRELEESSTLYEKYHKPIEEAWENKPEYINDAMDKFLNI